MVALFFSGATAQAKSEDLSVMSFNLRGKETDEAFPVKKSREKSLRFRVGMDRTSFCSVYCFYK